MRDRISSLLEGLDLARGAGLELGPLANPILRRPAANVLYADHIDTEGLRRKYAHDPHTDIQSIVPIDIVWQDGNLRDQLPPDHRGFDYIVASHVIEHVPDIVWWLEQLRAVLKPGGALRLIVPDRRFTMDLNRRESVLADALAAHLEARRAPRPREIIDYYVNYRIITPEAAWAGVEPAADAAALDNAEHAMTLSREALKGAYRDVHCWVFTPDSFRTLMADLARLGLLRLACRELQTTVRDELDFFAHLENETDADRIVASWTTPPRQVQPGPASQSEQAPQAPQAGRLPRIFARVVGRCTTFLSRSDRRMTDRDQTRS